MSPATCPGEDVPTSVPRIHRSPWIHRFVFGGGHWDPLGLVLDHGENHGRVTLPNPSKSLDVDMVFLGRKAWKTCGFRLYFCGSVPVAKFRDIGGVGVSCAPCLPEILTGITSNSEDQIRSTQKKKNITTPSQPISKQKVHQDPKHPINHL